MIILTNFIKTLVISTLLLTAFKIHVVQRLRRLAKRLQEQNWENPTAIGLDDLKWPFQKKGDEIHEIEMAINEAIAVIGKNIEQLQTAVQASTRMAELGTLSAGIAHEINNPLAIISGNISMLDKTIKQLPHEMPLLLKYSNQIDKSIKRISKIILGLRSFSRDGSKDPFERVTVKKILDDIIPICQAALLNKKVELEVQVDDESLLLDCRSAQIEQILMNLLNNAADAVASLDVRWVRLHVYKNLEGQTVFTVTDSGPGIPEEIRKKIFVPFFTTKPVGSGTGLGLAIVHGIVRQHQGSIEVNSNSPNTQFIIKFPSYEVKNVA